MREAKIKQKNSFLAFIRALALIKPFYQNEIQDAHKLFSVKPPMDDHKFFGKIHRSAIHKI
jgi:replication initiation and membrane attachment protein DnaB